MSKVIKASDFIVRVLEMAKKENLIVLNIKIKDEDGISSHFKKPKSEVPTALPMNEYEMEGRN